MPVLCIIIVYVTSCADCTYTVCACAIIELSHSSRARTLQRGVRFEVGAEVWVDFVVIVLYLFLLFYYYYMLIISLLFHCVVYINYFFLRM